jgi:hypothetical protein
MIRTASRRLPFLLLPGALLLVACLRMDAGAASVPLALDAGRPGTARVGVLEYRGGLVLNPGVPGFGGLSGLEVSRDGSRMWAVTDRGGLVTADLVHDGDGRLSGVRSVTVRPLLDSDGEPVAGSRSDSEDLTRLADGTWAVAFERWHRIAIHPGGDDGPVGIPASLPRPPGLREEAPGNGGIEALAALPDGRLFAVEEGREDRAGSHRAWIGGAEGWTQATYRGQAPYRPTGAAALTNGDVLVLERRASILGGFGARIARVPSAALASALIEGEELARIEAPLEVDNFEGIATAPAGEGGWNVYIVSDDNFWALQRTLLMMFHLPD